MIYTYNDLCYALPDIIYCDRIMTSQNLLIYGRQSFNHETSGQTYKNIVNLNLNAVNV